MIVAPGALALKVMPPEPMVSAPKLPWLSVTAPVEEFRKLIPATEKFWSSVVVIAEAPAFVALKLTVLLTFGANWESADPSDRVDQLVLVVPAPAFHEPLTSPTQ